MLIMFVTVVLLNSNLINRKLCMMKHIGFVCLIPALLFCSLKASALEEPYHTFHIKLSGYEFRLINPQDPSDVQLYAHYLNQKTEDVSRNLEEK